MRLQIAQEIFEWLRKAEEADIRRVVEAMSPDDARAFDSMFELWAHESQLPPIGDAWRVWLLMAGRGFGKTRAGAEWVHRAAVSRPGVRIALVGASIADARSVMVEGVSGLLKVAELRHCRLEWEPSLCRVAWSNGSEARLFSGDHADGLRGPEFDIAWCDELAKWREAEATWDNLQLALRRGLHPRVLVTTTPRPLPLLRRIREEPWTVTTSGRTADNVNLDARFAELMHATYAGTRIGRQELDGELLEDVEGALWTREMIEGAWVLRDGTSTSSVPPQDERSSYDRILVGVDPPAGAGKGSDACGIIVAGSRGEQLFVLEDASVQGLSPEGWASAVAMAAARWDAGLVVAEANNGGAMVESVLKAADSGLKVRLVHASRGKCARAEPIALRFEKKTAFLAGSFPELEAELCGMIMGGGYEGPGRSPDRADAMVWAMTALSESRSGVPRVRML